MTSAVVSRSPFDGTVVGDFSAASRDDVDAALERAREAAPEWAATPVEQRAAILEGFASRLDERAERLARLVVRETGKRFEEAGAEVSWTAASARWYAAHPPVEEQVGGALVRPVPLGVVAIVTPWNAPLITPAWKLCPALMAGNTVVWKPSELATAAAVGLAELLIEAGLTDGVLEVLPGPADVGAAVVSDPRVQGVHFTGSSEVGRKIAAVTAARLARCALELGGSNPALVLEDADVDAAVRAVVESMLAVNGQKCTATRRVLVREEVADAFAERLQGQLASAAPGDPADPTTRIGPLINAEAADRARSVVLRSLELGARRLAEAPAGQGLAAFSPVALSGVARDDPLRGEELFAPVLVVDEVRNDSEALAMANATPYGLAAAVHTAELERGIQLARRLEAGVVSVESPHRCGRARASVRRSQAIGQRGSGRWTLRVRRPHGAPDDLRGLLGSVKPSPRTNVGRRLEILTAVLRHEAEQGDGLGVVDVADAIGREKSQVSRGLRYLAAAELAQRDDDTLKFETGASLLRAASRGGDPALLQIAFAVLEELAATTGERAHLSVLCGREVLTVATVSPSSSVQAVGWVGRTTPAHCTASGEALLSDHDADALRALLGPGPLPAAGPAAPRTLDELVRRVSRVKEQRVSVVRRRARVGPRRGRRSDPRPGRGYQRSRERLRSRLSHASPDPRRVVGRAQGGRRAQPCSGGRELLGGGDLRLDAGALLGRAVDVEATVESLDAGGKAAQARAAVGVGAADAVVADRHRDGAVRPGGWPRSRGTPARTWPRS